MDPDGCGITLSTTAGGPHLWCFHNRSARSGQELGDPRSRSSLDLRQQRMARVAHAILAFNVPPNAPPEMRSHFGIGQRAVGLAGSWQR